MFKNILGSRLISRYLKYCRFVSELARVNLFNNNYDIILRLLCHTRTIGYILYFRAQSRTAILTLAQTKLRRYSTAVASYNRSRARSFHTAAAVEGEMASSMRPAALNCKLSIPHLCGLIVNYTLIPGIICNNN